MRIERLAALAALLVAPAFAETPDLAGMIRSDDRARLERLDEVAGRTLRSALALGSPEDRAILVEGLSGSALPAERAMTILQGEWSCRMLKLGGNLPLVVYQAFHCRLTGSGFEKLTGSQRTTGRIGLLDGQTVYLGTAFVAGDTPLPYGELPAEVDPGATPQLTPEVGLVEVTGDKAARILLPLPWLESELNVLMLTR